MVPQYIFVQQHIFNIIKYYRFNKENDTRTKYEKIVSIFATIKYVG